MDLIENKLNTLQNCTDTNALASQIYLLCTNITPQFYRKLTAEDMQAEIISIKILIQDIEPETLAEMCKRAIAQYPKDRSNDSKVYFDINYILKFYKEAYNDLHCNYITLKKGTKLVNRYYDKAEGILFEKWEYNGEIIETSCVAEEDEESRKEFEAEYGIKWRPKKHALRIYDFTDKELVAMYDNLDDIKL